MAFPALNRKVVSRSWHTLGLLSKRHKILVKIIHMLLSMKDFKLFSLQCLRESQATTKRTLNQHVCLL